MLLLVSFALKLMASEPIDLAASAAAVDEWREFDVRVLLSSAVIYNVFDMAGTVLASDEGHV